MRTSLTSFLVLALVGTCLYPFRASGAPAYPLKVSTNKRYLVDQNNVPFMVVGDSAWSLIVNLSEADARTYFANRQARGFNSVLLSILVGSNVFNQSNNDATYDGIIPFTTPGDLSTPNPTYFQRVDDMINLAAQYGLCVFLVATETDGWLATFENNGVTKCANYGTFLGNRYKNSPNIVWAHGNDYQTWPSGDNVLIPLANAIRAADPNHLATLELNYLNSCSLNDGNWASIVGINWVYTYFPTYAEELVAYNLAPTMPMMLGEANYEQEHNGNTDGGSVTNLRRQEYWTAFSGSTGQMYGSYWTDRFQNGWQNNLNTPGAIQLGYLVSLLTPLPWYNLVPDKGHSFVTAGIGTAYVNLGAGTASGTIPVDTYLTAAITPDGKFGAVYMPSARTITVDMTKLAGTVTVQWFDPSSGTRTNVSGSPFANSGKLQFTPPGNTSDGQSDWVLIFTASGAPPAPRNLRIVQ
jgi:hypothetical protein